MTPDADGNWTDEPPDDPYSDSAESGETADSGAVVRARFPATDLAALLSEDRPPRRWTVDGFLPEGASISIVASAKAGKSLVILHMCICLAEGTRFLGRPVRPCRVLYIDLENTEDDLAERLEALGITEDRARALVASGRLVHLCLPPIDPLDTLTGGQTLAQIVDAYGLTRGDVVVFDSTQRIVTGEENTADTWRAFYRHTASGLKRRGLGVVRLDNTGKDAEKGARGSSSKRDDVDVEWSLQRGGKLAGADGNYFRLTPERGRLLSGLSNIDATYIKHQGGTVSLHGSQSQRDRDIATTIRLLADLGLPDDAGKKTSWERVKAAENIKHKPTRSVVWAAVERRREGYQEVRYPPSETGVPVPVGTPRYPSAVGDETSRSDTEDRGTDDGGTATEPASPSGVPGFSVSKRRNPVPPEAQNRTEGDAA